MAKLYLVRHGQASFGQQNYDELSVLGQQQATWLGEYYADRQLQVSNIVTGTLRRQEDTGRLVHESMGLNLNRLQLPQLNEFDFQPVCKAYLTVTNTSIPAAGKNRQAYYRLLKQAMLSWSKGELDEFNLPETWAAFVSRAAEALAIIRAFDGDTIVVSSGGTIAMMLGQILQCNAPSIIKLNLQIRNTSVTECISTQSDVHLCTFNQLPHLDMPQRWESITYS